MRFGDHAWSMQYHVEVEDDTIDNWGAIPAYREALEKSLGKESTDKLRSDGEAEMADFVENARKL